MTIVTPTGVKMKETGIVRRIDELGRVVIPKEIRKTLRLKVGDPIEIYTEKDGLLFKKYSPLVSLQGFSEDVGESLYEMTQKTVVIADCNTVIFAKGKIAKNYHGKNISSALERAMIERKSIFLDAVSGSMLKKICDDDETEYSSQLIVPIISGGDVLGSIILLADDDTGKIGDSDIKLVKFSEDFIARQFYEK